MSSEGTRGLEIEFWEGGPSGSLGTSPPKRGGFPEGGPRSESLERSRQCEGHDSESHFSSITERHSGGASMVSHHFFFPALFNLMLFFIETDISVSAGRRERTASLTKSVGQENLVPHTILNDEGPLN